MFRAMFRYLKAIGYLITGQIDSARRVLDSNPNVMRATYDEVVRDKTTRLHQYKQAVASLIAQQEKKLQQVQSLTQEMQQLERLKSGAAAKAKQRVAQLQAQGKSQDDIQHDEEYLKCKAGFTDFSSTLTEKQNRIAELEKDIEDYGKRVGEHKVQLQQLMREIEKVQAEATDAVADVITAKEEREVADLLSGISQDGTSEKLQQMRDLRRELKAEARVSKELAGSETKTMEAEFLSYARSASANTEFDQLIGLAEKKDQGVKDTAVSTKTSDLPE